MKNTSRLGYNRYLVDALATSLQANPYNVRYNYGPTTQ